MRIFGSAAVLLLIIAILLIGPMQAAVERNWAMVAFRDHLVSGDRLERGTDTLAALSFGNVLDPTVLKPAMDVLQGSLARRSIPRSAAWNLGRMQMAVGDLRSAQRTLANLQTRSATNPLLYADILMAHWSLRDYEAIVDLYEQVPVPQLTDSISETIANAYLKVGDSDAPAQILELRPNDLWATYHRWLQDRQEGKAAGAEQFALSLGRFSLDAISPANDIRFNAALQTMPELFDQGIWDLHTLRSVVAYLVWRASDRPALENLLNTLSTRYPDSEIWPLYMGELYQRNGDLDAAAAMYAHAQSLNPQSAAVATYGIREDFGRATSDSDADLEFVATALGIDPREIQIGPSLIENSGFDRWQGDTPEGWRFETYMGGDSDNAVYVTGQDSNPPDTSVARILALRGGMLSDGTMTLGEYWGPQIVADGSRYLVTITYRSDGFTEGTPLIIFGNYSQAGGEILLLETLMATQATTETARFLTPASTPGTPLVPVIRNWGNGQLWIESIEVRPVYGIQVNNP